MDERALVDAGPLTALYNANDYHHREIFSFFQNTNVEHFITTDACIAEVMHNLKRVSGFHRVQAQVSNDICRGLWEREPLIQEDFSTITELFEQYSNVPADFADLTLVAISKRLNISQIVTLDSDFDIYRRLTTPPSPFIRIFYPRGKF